MIGFQVLDGKFRTPCNIDWWCGHLACLVIAVGSLAQEKMIFYEVLLCYVMSSGVYANIYRRINSCINSPSCCVDMYGGVQRLSPQFFFFSQDLQEQRSVIYSLWKEQICDKFVTMIMCTKGHRSWSSCATVMVTLSNKIPIVSISNMKLQLKLKH